MNLFSSWWNRAMEQLPTIFSKNEKKVEGQPPLLLRLEHELDLRELLEELSEGNEELLSAFLDKWGREHLAPYRAFIAKNQKELDQIKEGGGWKNFSETLAGSDVDKFETLRNEWIKFHQDLVFIGCFSAWGSQGVKSDIDTQFNAPVGMNVVTETDIKILFDRISYYLLGESTNYLFNTECYLKHQGFDGERFLSTPGAHQEFNRAETLTSLIKLNISQERGSALKEAVGEECGQELIDMASRLYQRLQPFYGDTHEKMDQRSKILHMLAKQIDLHQKNLAAKVRFGILIESKINQGPTEAEKEELAIEFLKGFSNFLFGDTYVTQGALAHAVGNQMNGKQIQEALKKKPKIEKEGAYPIPMAIDAPFDRPFNDADRIGCALENMAMFHEKCTDPDDFEYLVEESKYFVRPLEYFAREPAEIKGDNKKLEELRDLAYELEAVKRGKLPRILIDKILTDEMAKINPSSRHLKIERNIRESSKANNPVAKMIRDYEKRSLEPRLKEFEWKKEATSFKIKKQLNKMNTLSGMHGFFIEKKWEAIILEYAKRIGPFSVEDDKKAVYELVSTNLLLICNEKRREWGGSLPHNLEQLAREISGYWEGTFRNNVLTQSWHESSQKALKEKVSEVYGGTKNYIDQVQEQLFTQIKPILPPPNKTMSFLLEMEKQIEIIFSLCGSIN